MMTKPLRKHTIIPALILMAMAAGAPAQTSPHDPARPAAQTLIPPSDPLIRYTGRFDARDPGGVRFDWPGNTIELRFGGTSCAVKVRGDGGRYNIFINDSLFVKRFDTLETTYQLASGLADTVHRLRIVKRFEGWGGRVVTVKGFFIDGGQTLRPLGPAPGRRIEFTGGSNLLGFGAEYSFFFPVACFDPGGRSNAGASFASIAARELGAERHIVAMSGKGLTRNYKSPFLASPRAFGEFYRRTVKNDSTLTWDFNSWTPQVVVTSFGVNDFSTNPQPPKELFTAQYRGFISGIQRRYPGVQVVCVTSSREPIRAYVREMVENMRRDGDRRVHFYAFGPVPERDRGCDWHPNVNAHARIGKELADVIRPLFEEMEE